MLSGLAINYFLGGFNRPELMKGTMNEMTIHGMPYEGRYASDSLDNMIDWLQSQIDTTGIPGSLVIVNYLQEDLEKRGVVKQFVGLVADQGIEFKHPLDTLVLPASETIQFTIPVNPLVMPSPEKLKKMAIDEAEKNQVSLVGYSIEQYRNRKLIVSFPAK